MSNIGGLLLLRFLGPLAFFGMMFAIILPPVGFFMGLYGYKENKIVVIRGTGRYIFVMVLSVITTIVYIIVLIVLLNAYK